MCIFLFVAFVKKHMWPWISLNRLTRARSSLISRPIFMALCLLCSLTKVTSWKHTRM